MICMVFLSMQTLSLKFRKFFKIIQIIVIILFMPELEKFTDMGVTRLIDIWPEEVQPIIHIDKKLL